MTHVTQIIVNHVLENDEEDFKDVAYGGPQGPGHFTDRDLDDRDTIVTTRDKLIYAPLDWQKRGLQQTASGYGGKLNSGYNIIFNGRVYRIYITVYGNSGTAWFKAGSRRIVVDTV